MCAPEQRVLRLRVPVRALPRYPVPADRARGRLREPHRHREHPRRPDEPRPPADQRIQRRTVSYRAGPSEWEHRVYLRGSRLGDDDGERGNEHGVLGFLCHVLRSPLQSGWVGPRKTADHKLAWPLRADPRTPAARKGAVGSAPPGARHTRWPPGSWPALGSRRPSGDYSSRASDPIPLRVDRRLLAIRLRRRHILIELCPVLAAPASLAFIETRLPTDSAIAPTVFGIALVLYLAASTRFCLHFVAVLKESCPRCSGFFFVSWHRFLY